MNVLSFRRLFSLVLLAGVVAALPAHAAFRFSDKGDPLAAAREGAPMALTASDGTGLVLVGMEANAVLEGPLALTELRLTFQNPLDRVLEGRFQITLPARATVSRFAMKTDKRWQEGEVIERERARRVYEDFLHRRQDPALLEQGEANEFGARVFPIPAKGEKELILSYTQPLAAADAPYVLPLKGLSRVGRLDVTVSGGAAPFALHRRDFVPNQDVEVAQQPGIDGLRHEELVVVRAVPVKASAPATVESLLFLVDTSASRALAFERQVQLIRSLTKALADGGQPNAKVGIVAFDQGAAVLFEGKAAGVDRRVLQKIRRRRAMGASDLEQALAFVAKNLRQEYSRGLLISDGVATAGDKGTKALNSLVGKLATKGVQRLDAAILGGLRDEDRLRALVVGSLAKDGAVIDADRGVRHVADKMTRTTRSDVALQVEGAEWTWPVSVSGIQAGDSVLVFARLEKGVKTVRLRIDNKSAGQVATTEVARPLLERSVIEAEIARLSDARDALTGPKVASERKRLKDVIVSLSTKHRVLSRFTSLLVLETAADYARYGIAETALSDILVVKDGKIAIADRRALPAKPKPKPVLRPQKKTTSGVKKRKAKSSSARNGNAAPARATAGMDDSKSDDDDKNFDGRASGESMDVAIEKEEVALNGAPAGAPREMDAPASDAVASADESEREPPTASSDRLRGGGGDLAPPPPPAAPMRERRPSARRRPPRDSAQGQPQKLPQADAWTGKFADVMGALKTRKFKRAITLAQSWREEEPGDVLALVALGRAFAAQGKIDEAARAYGSIIDLFPARADLRRFAGNLLESLNDKRALVLASESYGEATKQRRDHPAGWRLYAFSLARLGHFEDAMKALEEGIATRLPSGRFAGVPQILREDLGLIAAMRLRAEGNKGKRALEQRLKKVGAQLESAPSVRFVLSWETDANDVDFHIYDARGGHAFYGTRDLPNGGGSLYADVTTGYGPECFTVRKPKKKRAGPYRMRAHYYSRGPMGYGMGALQVIDNDRGKISVTTKPFIVMKDSAYVDLGTVR